MSVLCIVDVLPMSLWFVLRFFVWLLSFLDSGFWMNRETDLIKSLVEISGSELLIVLLYNALTSCYARLQWSQLLTSHWHDIFQCVPKWSPKRPSDTVPCWYSVAKNKWYSKLTVRSPFWLWRWLSQNSKALKLGERKRPTKDKCAQWCH